MDFTLIIMEKKIMKTVILTLILTFNLYSQKVNKDTFSFIGEKIEYTIKLAKKNNENFNIIIINDSVSSEKLKLRIIDYINEKCNINETYFIVIPSKFLIKKEDFVLNYICEILSKRKLIDRKMNIISDENYFNFYNQIKEKNKSKYNNCYLNKIQKLVLINENSTIKKIIK
jgi:hypothetical protein